ncbi:MAG: alcohol dehydrogenase catalytic domain-containing protein [Alphaproteobacteria bacterium]|nr:alcohol dehydrogenase catalytic domain-containing protein [Alphaproteobacteria bacterium]
MICEAIVAYGEPLQRVEIPTPVPQGSEVLLEVTECGVCHSDVHLHDGYFGMGGENKLDVKGGRKLPFALGHEIGGRVVAVGPDVKGVKIGERRVAFPWIGCGDCPACNRDEEQFCNKPRNLGVQINGGYASHVLVPHEKYALDFGKADPALAAAYMCSGLTAFGALKKIGKPTKSDPIAIVGLGGVGMMGLQFARAMFDCPIIGVDVDPAKLEAAKAAGASAVVNSREDGALKKFLGETGGAYAAVDFVGSEASFAFAQGCVRKGGKVVIVGLFGGAFTMPIPLLPMRAISIAGSYVGSLPETHEMLALVKAGKIDPIPVTRRKLSEATRTLDDLREGKIVGRVVLEPA